jgi:hypothetical protein
LIVDEKGVVVLIRLASELTQIAEKLDARGQHAIADRVTNILIKLAQVGPAAFNYDPNNTQSMMQMYNPNVAKNPNAYYKTPNPLDNPNTWQKAMIPTSQINPDSLSHLKGLSTYDELMYGISPQYKQDYISDRQNYYKQPTNYNEEMSTDEMLQPFGWEEQMMPNFDSEFNQQTLSKDNPAYAPYFSQPNQPYWAYNMTPQNKNYWNNQFQYNQVPKFRKRK